MLTSGEMHKAQGIMGDGERRLGLQRWPCGGRVWQAGRSRNGAHGPANGTGQRSTWTSNN